MDSYTGGQSSAERQRQTATEIARKKVLAAYSANQINPKDWQKYHTAWQNYYQKYYSDYYAKAASQYIANEQLRQERAKRDQARTEAETTADTPPVESEELIKRTLKDRIQAKAGDKFYTKKRRRHLIPILAGISVVIILLFLQFNRVIFAPIMAYVAPGNTTDTGITALNPTVTTAPGPESKLIIPKLNVEVPIAFGISNDDATVMEAMNHGVAHFAIPGAEALPGQVGNLVITGHSAGDIYSDNPYKFIFSGLERLNDGDLIYVNYNSVRYTYSVVGKQTVEPSNVAALVYDTDKPMLTLITCTPLGTSRYRLLVSAEQISPTPDTTSERPSSSSNTSEASTLPSNEPSFFEGIWNWLTGNH